MTTTIFIDGEAGTTGLQIRDRLAGRRDIKLLSLDHDRRKDPAARSEMLNRADISILCLPDEASRRAVTMVDSPDVRLIDASIAYRTDGDWVYGMAEYGPDQPARIAAAKRVTNPGCYACSSIAMLRPLVVAGIVPTDFPITLNAVSGYSGGGRKLIETFEDAASPDYTESTFYLYALGLEHKHTEEIRVHGGLDRRPLFVPSVGRFAQGNGHGAGEALQIAVVLEQIVTKFLYGQASFLSFLQEGVPEDLLPDPLGLLLELVGEGA